MKKLDPKIAIIDDDRFLLKTFLAIISKNFPSIDVEAYASVEEAMPALQAETYNIVITDIEMPGKKGDMLLVDLNAIASGIQTIVMTGDSGLALIASCFRNGARAFIKKPVAAQEVVHAIQQCIDNLRYWQSLMRQNH